MGYASNNRLFPYTTLFRSQSLGRREYLGLLAHVRGIFIATRRALDIAVGVSAILPWCSEVTAKLLLTALTRTPGRATAIAKGDRKSTRLNSSHVAISYAVF